jgi:hypothetical protein
MGIKFFLKSDVNADQLKYTAEITKWTPRGLDVLLDFEEP